MNQPTQRLKAIKNTQIHMHTHIEREYSPYMHMRKCICCMRMCVCNLWMKSFHAIFM